ncbi:hypothetical protein FB451DRAFT_1441693 [Mycena latifolia]|nr:hypothetical protein FB451DRAFT_1441693 [Mycena latifolia]
MSTTGNTAASSPPPPGRGAKLPRFKTSSQSKSDWLATSLMTAKAFTAAAGCIPFPYVKDVFGTAVAILETVEKVKKNRDDLKELCENIMEIIKVVQVQLTTHNDTAALKFKGLCEDLESVLQDVLKAVMQLQMKDRGLNSRFKEVMKLGSTADEISGYRTRIQELRFNFLVLSPCISVMAAIDTNLQVHKGFAAGKQLSKIDVGLTKINADWELSVSDPPAILIMQSSTRCPPPSRIFHGQHQILDKMHKFFEQDLSQQHIFLLHGLGGAGKTQIALKFIQESSSRFSEMFLIDTSTPETIETGLKNIAATKTAGSRVQDALEWLSSQSDEWLLLFDNADDPKINLHKSFPQCTHGNILITSRNPGLRVYAGSHAIVSDMEATDAVELLLKSAAVATTPANKDIAIEIVKSHDNYAWTVYTTWQISFDKLSKLAATFLQLSTCPSKEELKDPLEFLSQFLGPAGTWDSLHFMKVTNELRAYSLISLDLEKNIFSIHPLVHSWSQTILTDRQSYQYWAAAILGMSITRIRDEDAQLASLEVLPHIDSLIGEGTNLTPDFKRRSKDAHQLHLAVLADRRNFLGEDHPHTLSEMFKLAVTHAQLGELQEAQELEVVVLEKRRKILGDDHPDTLHAMGNLAVIYQKLGQSKEAEELKVVVLKTSRKILGEDHPDTLTAMANLAVTYQDLGQFKEAEELEVVVLKMWRKILGEDHPDTLSAMANLGATYQNLDQLKKAEELEVVALEKGCKILGKDHPDTLCAMHNLGVTYQGLSQLKKAEELKVVVLVKWRRILGEAHRDTLCAMQNLALTYYHQDQFTQAEQTNILGHDHSDT